MGSSTVERKGVRFLIALVVGAVTFVVVMVADGLAIAAISKLTGSGLLGICGPYGSDGAIYFMLAMLVVGPVAGLFVGVVTGRRYYRWRAANLDAGQAF